MRTVSLRDETQRAFGPVRVAETAWERTRGLLGREMLQPGEGLLILRCGSVHTFGMRYRIDVVFLDAQGVVRRVAKSLAPARMAWCRSGRHVLELAGGQAEALGLTPGMRLAGWQVNESRN